ncbi:hypothetical protein FKW77_009838 [Venturia effusa]|uniref:Cutinase n=1 Tax=Venturia effusa TaxID=50376 RepID=A0A517L869_9PEZI|nr:hypothetical protein FKW77_009838 [Venturia effusa]
MAKYTALFLSLLTLTTARVVTTKRASSTTATDVTNGICKPLTLIFARGTTELGNMGSVVGPPFATALKTAFGADKVAVQGVDYPADIVGAVSGATAPQSAAGARNMVAMVRKLEKECPQTRVVLSGYSQGAEQVRGALMGLEGGGMVAAAITFGDPLQNQKFANIDASRTKVNCAPGDQVCNEAFVVGAAHLSYGSNGDIGDSVEFVRGVVGM